MNDDGVSSALADVASTHLVIMSSNADTSTKIGAKVQNSIRDSFAIILAPFLSTVGYLLPLSKLDIASQLHLPSDPHIRPFDLTFNSDPTSPPLINHACP